MSSTLSLLRDARRKKKSSRESKSHHLSSRVVCKFCKGNPFFFPLCIYFSTPFTDDLHENLQRFKRLKLSHNAFKVSCLVFRLFAMGLWPCEKELVFVLFCFV